MKRTAPAFALLLVACGSERPSQPVDGPAQAASRDAPKAWFEDVTEFSGLDFVHDSGATPDKHLPETMGAGAALIDANGDGVLDVYLVQGGPLPTAPGATRGRDLPANRLYVGTGGGRFRDIGDACGEAADRGYGMGVAAGDVDCDGTVDLYITCFGPDRLLVGDDSGDFLDLTDHAGLGDERWTAGPLLFDADQDGDLDLYVTAYVQVDLDDPTWCGERRPGWRSYCHPDHYPGLPDRFWRNEGEGRFSLATDAAGLGDNTGKGLGAIACDLDDDGDLDLYVANDGVENKLWRNQGDGTFTDATLLTGTGVNRSGATEAGMGLAVGDPDGDGDFDLFVTNFDDESNTLYRNDGDGMFTDATIAAGLDAASRMPVGFGCVLEDFDLDGDLDLAVANGHIIDNIHLYHDGKTWVQVAQLFINRGGRFDLDHARAGGLSAQPFVGRGLYAGDLDGDGDPDLLLTQCGGPARLLSNVIGGPSRVIRGLAPGARVEALRGGKVLVRQNGLASSYLGLGEEAVFLPADAEQVRVRAPGGTWQER